MGSLSSALLLSLGVETARVFRGGLGECVRVGVCERAVDEDHPQLREGAPFVVGVEKDSLSDLQHGTMTAGVLAADGPDIEGICPRATVFFACTDDSCVHISIIKALPFLRKGDVLLLEAQTGVDPHFLPSEYFPPNLEQIRAAVVKGVVVVEAAGNGSQDVDPFITWDSGAVMVGSTHTTTNTGKRVDVTGPGVKVPSLAPGGGTMMFSGTSSASAVAAGVCALVNSIRKSYGMSALDSVGMREVMRRHGLNLKPILREMFPCPDADEDGVVSFAEVIAAIRAGMALSVARSHLWKHWPEDYAR